MSSSASRAAVLLLTHSGDFFAIDLVTEALTRKGARPLRLNTDLFPSTVKLSARAGDDRWVNDLQRERAAENKQRQLRVAERAGLRVPRTLVTIVKAEFDLLTG